MNIKKRDKNQKQTNTEKLYYKTQNGNLFKSMLLSNRKRFLIT